MRSVIGESRAVLPISVAPAVVDEQSESDQDMKLNEISDNEGARKRRMRSAAASGSGKGKTAGRGVKGQKCALGRRDQRLRRRPDAALHAHAEARLQQPSFCKDLPIVNLGLRPEAHRRRQARCQG